MASGPITLWKIDGETMETVTDFIFLGSRITADGVWSQKINKMNNQQGPIIYYKELYTILYNNLNRVEKEQMHV